jgi:hypothetical protein
VEVPGKNFQVGTRNAQRFVGGHLIFSFSLFCSLTI